MPLAELLGHERRGRRCRRGRGPRERTTAPGLMLPTRLSVWKRGHRGQPLLLLVLGLPRPDPRLEPALAGEDQAVLAGRSGLARRGRLR